MMTCRACGEWLIGDGYTTVIHCPDAPEDEVSCAEPDAYPIYCKLPEDPAHD